VKLAGKGRDTSMISRSDIDSTVDSIAWDDDGTHLAERIALLEYNSVRSIRLIGEYFATHGDRMEVRLALEKITSTANVMIEKLKTERV
jgi:hypothetical protein